MSFSREAARTWSKDHVREVKADIQRDLEQTRIDYERETNPYSRRITEEKIEEFESDIDFLDSIL